MIVLAIDPGSVKSGFVIFDSASYKLLDFGKIKNEDLLETNFKRISAIDLLAIEFPRVRGQFVHNQVFDTVYWVGRFAQKFYFENKYIPFLELIDRKDVKKTLLGKVIGTDKTIREALITLYNDKFNLVPTEKNSVPCRGIKKEPGPLYGVANDVWQALGVAITCVKMRTRCGETSGSVVVVQ